MNVSPLSVLALGFLLGLKHATDADHVVAVTAIVSRQRKLRHAALVGITWGIGHTFMIVVVGIAIILFHITIPEKTQLSFELLVSAALIVLGTLNLTGTTKRLQERFSDIHGHLHHHDHIHTHVHRHAHGVADHTKRHEQFQELLAELGMFQLIRPLVVGLIHGLAGSAAIALLVLGSIADQYTALVYLGIFGIGTIVGMMALTTLLGIPIVAGSRKFARFDRIATIIAGLVSIGYGLYFGYEIGFVEGLFTGS